MKSVKSISIFRTFYYQQSFTSITNENHFSGADIKHYGMILSLGFNIPLVSKLRELTNRNETFFNLFNACLYADINRSKK
jgi:hypothetical protein